MARPDPPPFGAPLLQNGQIGSEWWRFFQGLYTASTTASAAPSGPTEGGITIDGGAPGTVYSGDAPIYDMGGP